MKKKTIRIFILLSALLLVLAGVLYYNFYHINLNRFSLRIGQGAAESPSGNYMIKVSVCPVAFIPEDTDYLTYICDEGLEAYVIGELWREPVTDAAGVKQWDSQSSRVIYYDKFDDCTVEFHWIDDDTLVINGITLNLPTDTYDFRRNIQNF